MKYEIGETVRILSTDKLTKIWGITVDPRFVETHYTLTDGEFLPESALTNQCCWCYAKINEDGSTNCNCD